MKTRTIIIATIAAMGIVGETEDGLRGRRLRSGRGDGILDGGILDGCGCWTLCCD